MQHEMTRMEVAALKREHTALDEEIFEWRQWWEQLSELGQPHFGEMGDRLASFREHLLAHFAHEESEGCLSVLRQLPKKAADAALKLRKEHPQLLSELDRLVTRLHQTKPAFSCWSSAREEFEFFLDRLNSHEESEDAFLDQLR